MGRVLIGLVIIAFLLPVMASLKINEMELNPAGTDSGNEWVEFYSEEEIDLSEYKIVNGDGSEVILEGSCNGYCTYTFLGQWLDNENEKIILYKGQEKIEETPELSDTKNDNRAWSYCPGWQFLESTKGKINSCQITPGDEEEEEETDGNETEEEEETENNETEKSNSSGYNLIEFAELVEKETPKKLEIISLDDAKDIKTEEPG